MVPRGGKQEGGRKVLWGGGGEGCGCIFSESGWGGLIEKGESELMCRR